MFFIRKIIRAKGEDTTYKFHSTQINLYDCCSEKDGGFNRAQLLIKDPQVYREHPQIKDSRFGFLKDDPKEEYGYESKPHITVLYGLENEDDYFKIRKSLASFGEVPFTIGNIGSFRHDTNPYDVIILEIESTKLKQLHTQLREKYKNQYKYPEYKPHMTLAYVKKGECKDIEGPCAWTGTKYKAPKMIWSHTDGYYLDIPFTGKGPVSVS